jgi:hypothetical protein
MTILFILEIVMIQKNDVQIQLDLGTNELKLEIEIKIVFIKEKILYLIEK